MLTTVPPLDEQARAWLDLVSACNRQYQNDVNAAHIGAAISDEGTTFGYLYAEAEEKAREIAAYSENGPYLRLPTKLAAVSAAQRALVEYERFLTHGQMLQMTAENKGVSFHLVHPTLPEPVFVGRAQAKHARWLRQLLPYGAAAFALQVTGKDKGVRGLNVELLIGPALVQLLQESRRAEAQMRAVPTTAGATAAPAPTETPSVLVDPYKVLERSGLSPDDLPVAEGGAGAAPGEKLLVPAGVPYGDNDVYGDDEARFENDYDDETPHLPPVPPVPDGVLVKPAGPAPKDPAPEHTATAQLVYLLLRRELPAERLEELVELARGTRGAGPLMDYAYRLTHRLNL